MHMSTSCAPPQHVFCLWHCVKNKHQPCGYRVDLQTRPVTNGTNDFHLLVSTLFLALILKDDVVQSSIASIFSNSTGERPVHCSVSIAPWTYPTGVGVGSGARLGWCLQECVICLSEPRDTAVLPCRHMCMCSACAHMLRHQTNRCPICRTIATDYLNIKVQSQEDKHVQASHTC
mmetsp:Transcript_46972/g.87562  ORF Transcript_46972/g.87562 Transcript_46972/m.87562 type:complete len:175 (-) Transcript_46972:440-964(-)